MIYTTEMKLKKIIDPLAMLRTTGLNGTITHRVSLTMHLLSLYFF